MTHSHPHRARYDSAGNIIIEEARDTIASSHAEKRTSSVETLAVQSRQSRHGIWTVEEETTKKPAEHVPLHRAVTADKNATRTVQPSHLPTLSHQTKKITQEALGEGKKQLRETMKNVHAELETVADHMTHVPSRARGLMKRVWKRAQEPLITPRPKKTKKPRSKLQLFFIDTVRFGGTFALIFGVLFTAINYQSFYQIAKAEFALGDDIQNEKDLQDIVSGTERNAVSGMNGTISRVRKVQDLRALLPDVGPMEDRLVIPKLGKNVPIVRPGMDALMREDWPKFEEDIQEALRDGVVHYPGSARPGQAGNFFLTGHSSYYPWVSSKYKDVFARLGELGIGDTYSVFYGGDRHTYRIIEKKEVKPSNVTVLDQPTDKRLATLMTCTPVGTTLRRLILIAEEIDPQTNLALTVGEKVAEEKPNLKLKALPI